MDEIILSYHNGMFNILSNDKYLTFRFLFIKDNIEKINFEYFVRKDDEFKTTQINDFLDYNIDII